MIHKPMRVLYVDDNADLADIVTASLTAENDQFEIETATSTDEAIDKLTTDIDCVVSDYNMPAKNGLALLEAVRAEHPALPFILYTNKGSEEIASAAISKGVTDYIQKNPTPASIRS
jgi:Response regulator containing CheY-like receiver, AAA-type ATPase, and DNA-binding domains